VKPAAGATQISIKGRALRLLGQREHSRAELLRKLAAHEKEPGELGRALDDLQARGFISQERVAESVVHRRAAKLGSQRIRQELQAKGLEPQIVQETLAALRGSELERAHAVWQRKFDAPPANASERAKQTRFLLARGFTSDVVRRLLAASGSTDLDESI